MDDHEVQASINRLQDLQERRQLRAHLQREGRSEAFGAALAAALDRQAQKTRREEIVLRPARWMAGKAGGLVGRVMRKLEQEAEKLDREQQK